MADQDQDREKAIQRWAQLTPDQQQALLEYSQVQPARSDILKQELARAEALRKSEGQVPAYGFWGPALNGVGNGIKELVAGHRQNKIEAEQLKNAKDSAALVAKGSPWKQQPAQAEAPDVQFSAPFSAAGAPSAPAMPSGPAAQGVTPNWGMDLTQQAPAAHAMPSAPATAEMPGASMPGAAARAAGQLAGLSPERINAALGPDFPGAGQDFSPFGL